MKKPTCEQCEKEGLKYTVTQPMYGTTTLLAYTPGYWDEEGYYHVNKDPNSITFSYQCSNGHSWSE